MIVEWLSTASSSAETQHRVPALTPRDSERPRWDSELQFRLPGGVFADKDWTIAEGALSCVNHS